MKHIKLLACIALATFAWACQPELVPSLELKSSENVSVPVDGDVVSIKFETNIPWTVESSQSWVTVSPSSGEGQEGEITVKASVIKNDSNDSRSAVVTIKAGTLSKAVNITQGQLDALDVNATSFEVGAEGGNVEIPVSANVSFEVEIPAAIDWVSVVSTKAMTSSTVTLAVAPSYDTEARTANITIKAGDIKKPVSISQAAFEPYYDLLLPEGVGQFSGFGDGSPLILPQDCTSYTIEVNTNLEHYCYFAPWDSNLGMAVETNDVGWIKFEYDADKIVFTLEPNDSYIPREEYFYSGCFVGDIDFGAYGSCVLIRQEGKVPEAGANVVWTKLLSEIGVPSSAYHRLAYKTAGGDALLISDGAQIHALSPADATYWKAITPAVTPTSIASDDAGNVIIAPDYEFHPGTSYDVYWTADINAAPQVLIHHDADFDGVIGSWRVRGDISNRAVVTGFVTGNRYWAGWEIDKGQISMDNYYAQGTGGQARGPIAVDADAWTPEAGAVMSIGPRLNEGVVYRAYDTDQRLYYLSDAYTPNWLVPYNWAMICEAGAGGNECQNNMDIIDYNGRRIMAYSQGIYWGWGGNANVYFVDVTNPANAEVIAILDGSQLASVETFAVGEDYGWATLNAYVSADVKLHVEEGLGLVCYVVNSSLESLSKILLVF
ncbi:MAG: BACON domain-containing protein [Bacteroidales bacterium]|nr:BACON domain-containing protein [Bacteroidales bacterium]